MQLGMVGLGRMGSGMTKRLQQAGHDMKTYDPNVESTAKTLGALAKQLEAPRHVWMMVPSGKITEDTFQKLLARPRARRHDHRRRQLELPRLAAALQGGAEAEDLVRRHRRLGRHLGPRGRLLPDGRRRQGAAEAAAADLRDARARGRLRARRRVRGGPLHEDGPQRDRVRADAGLRRGLRADVPLGVRPRPERDRRHLALRLGRALVAARAAARGDGAARRQARRHRAATSRTPARAAGRSTRRSTRTCRCR